jgi:hypothetical protein
MVDQRKLDALEELEFDPTIGSAKILLYGEPGARKTTLGASIGDRVLFIMADPAGYESLYNHPELGLGTRIRTMRYTGISQLETLADVFTEGGTKYDQYDTIMLDTMSNIASLDRDVVTKQKIKKAGGEASFSWEDQQWPIYNQNTLRVTTALLKLMLSPVNVIMTAHAVERENKATGKIITRPKFSPEIFASIAGQCSMIAYCTANKLDVDDGDTVVYKSQIQYHPTKTIVAKTRIGGLPVSEDLPQNLGNTLHGSRLRQIVKDWTNKGGSLLSHEEAEEVHPDEAGVNPPVKSSDNEPSEPSQSLEDFSI